MIEHQHPIHQHETPFKIYLDHHISQFEIILKKFLMLLAPLDETETKNAKTSLSKALHYSLFNGGKRLRPLLVYSIGEAFDTPIEYLHAPAVAVELIHGFSLVHDDLPAMDNDDFRRGKPTCHKAFNEATAILVGDALQSLAFEILSDSKFNPISPLKQIQMIQILSKATGIQGMVGGQALDMACEQYLITETLDSLKLSQAEFPALQTLQELHHKKTGALFTASILMGYFASDKYREHQDNKISNKINNDPLFLSLKQFGDLVGLAFQVQDDLLDVEGNFKNLGKTPGKDLQSNKLTFPKLLGLEQTKKFKHELYEQAMVILKTLPFSAWSRTKVEQIAHFFIHRNI